MPVVKKPLKGVGGVLGNLISPEPEADATTEPPALTAPALPAIEPVQAEESLRGETPRRTGLARPQARRGRPPGKRVGEAVDKEKVTLRLSKELMDEYREWSWEDRCQLGELVERALSQYRRHRSRQKSQ
jgi:hypothetical protein